MALIECPECGGKVSDKAPACIHCGYPLQEPKEEQVQYRLPFGGGSGAAVNINPVAFLIVQADTVKLLPVNHASSLDKVLDYAPDIIEKIDNFEKQVKIKFDDNKVAWYAFSDLEQIEHAYAITIHKAQRIRI